MTSNPSSPINALHPSVVDQVDPDFARVYTEHQAHRLRADQVSYEEFNRDRGRYAFPTSKAALPAPEVASAAFHTVPVRSYADEPGFGGRDAAEIRVQVYTPLPAAVARAGLERAGRVPALVNYHGGGFVLGGLDSDEGLCRKLCDGLGIVVVNVEYRLAPEYPHPAQVTDGWDAYRWTVDKAEQLGIDPQRIAVSGLSAGGCIAASVSWLASQSELPVPALQVLIVPVLDARYVPPSGSCDAATVPYKSYVDYEYAPMLPLHRLVWFYNLWLGEGAIREKRANDHLASPILAELNDRFAPVVIYSGQIDPLLSEGEAYCKKLQEAGISAQHKVWKGQGHPFTQWDAEVPAAREFMKECMADLTAAFSK